MARKSETHKTVNANNVLTPRVTDENIPPVVSVLSEQSLRDRAVQAKYQDYETKIKSLKEKIKTLEQQVEVVEEENRELRQG